MTSADADGDLYFSVAVGDGSSPAHTEGVKERRCEEGRGTRLSWPCQLHTFTKNAVVGELRDQTLRNLQVAALGFF